MTKTTPLLDRDPSDDELRRTTHPPDWRNPRADGRYNLVVVGGGTAGLVSAGFAALLGAKVALVERDLMGGDCLVTGCVPSKAMIRAARVADNVRAAAEFGMAAGVEVDFAKVMDRMRRVRARIGHHDAASEFARKYGVDAYFGDAAFRGASRIEVAGQTLAFRRAVIATGGRAATPEIPGLPDAGFHTNETVFNLTQLPRRLAVIGGGPIGCELAQAFARLGSEVTIVHSGERLLPHDDAEAGAVLLDVLKREGLRVMLGSTVARVEAAPDGKVLQVRAQDGSTELRADAILVGAGRAPNVEGLGLDAAGVEHGKDGIKVDDFLRTTNRNIFAAGDVCLREKFTHTADASARLAVQNALLHRRLRWSRQVIPWVTYTDPEVAHVGIGLEQAREKGIEVDSYHVPLTDVDRALTDGEAAGFVKIVTRKGKGRPIGATVVAPHAGEMIGEITAAITGGLSLKQLSEIIHPYPTYAEAFRKAADEHQQKRLTPRARWLFGKWFALGR